MALELPYQITLRKINLFATKLRLQPARLADHTMKSICRPRAPDPLMGPLMVVMHDVVADPTLRLLEVLEPDLADQFVLDALGVAG